MTYSADELQDDIDLLEGFRDRMLLLCADMTVADIRKTAVTDEAAIAIPKACDAIHDGPLHDELDATISVLRALLADRQAQEPAEFPDDCITAWVA
jgi:hypothetical protein